MIYQTAKCIGGLAAAADGGDRRSCPHRRHCQFGAAGGKAAPEGALHCSGGGDPGEFEMEALAAGITRVLKGEEKARVYREHEEEGA